MRILGAILAGGASSRFGSDKALATLSGRALIDHVAAALASQCDGLVVVGRTHGGIASVPDRPAAGLGPLGGLAGALHHAAGAGFDLVLAAPCDMPRLPLDLARRLAPAPAFVADHPVVGLWPVSAAAIVDRLIAQERRAMRALADATHARPVDMPGLANVNRREDLARLRG